MASKDELRKLGIGDRLTKMMDQYENKEEPQQDSALILAGRGATLIERLGALNEKNVFQEGDLIQWKPGLQNALTAAPMIVVEVLDEPILDSEKNSSCNRFRQPLDLLIGATDSDGDFDIYHSDSRRMEPYTGPRLEDI